MPDCHAARRDRLRATLDDGGPSAILISAPINVRYLTGFTGDSTPLIVTRDRALAVSDFRYIEQLAEECPDVEAVIRPVDRKLWAAVAEVVGKLGETGLGFEVSGMLVSDLENLRAALDTIPVKGMFGRVENLRAIKDDEEVAEIRRAILAAERAFTMFRAGLRPEESEIDAADALEHFLRRCGSSAASFEPIVAAGARSALPHARPSSGVCVGQGGFLLVDWGATVGGYRSDLTRMIATGTVGGEFARVYQAVQDAQARAIAAIRPGVRAAEVDARARSAIDAAGFGGLFGHGLGHGLGLMVHEAPSLRPDSEDVLEAGMVVTVEPGIYRPGWGGIRIEDDVLVTADGAEVLTHLPRSIDSLSPY